MEKVLIEHFHILLNEIDEITAKAYEDKSLLLIDYVNNSMPGINNFNEIIDYDLIEVMKTNHENHVSFMSSVLYLKSAESLVNTIIWVYRSYISRGFSSDYFIKSLSFWKEGVTKFIEPHFSQKINKIYQFIIDNHHNFIEMSKPCPEIKVNEKYYAYFRRYLNALIDINIDDAMNLAREFIKTPDDILLWLEHIIEPSLYEIGRKWSEGEITVGQEHIATSITQRVMAVFYPIILRVPKTKPQIVIASSPGELHEIGPLIIADALETKGWNVYFMGANTPVDSIVSFLNSKKIRFLGISTTMPFNLKKVEFLIEKIRMECNHNVHIIVGGQAYIIDSFMWKQIGADGFAGNIKELLTYFERVEL